MNKRPLIKYCLCLFCKKVKPLTLMHSDEECLSCRSAMKTKHKTKTVLARWNYEALHSIFITNERMECFFFVNSDYPRPKQGRLKLWSTTRRDTKIWTMEIHYEGNLIEVIDFPYPDLKDFLNVIAEYLKRKSFKVSWIYMNKAQKKRLYLKDPAFVDQLRTYVPELWEAN